MLANVFEAAVANSNIGANMHASRMHADLHGYDPRSDAISWASLVHRLGSR